MNAREIVKATIKFQHPIRVARSFGDKDFNYLSPDSDFTGESPAIKGYEKAWKKIDEKHWEKFDIWGNKWSRLDDTSKGEVTDPVLKTLDNLKNYEFPDFSNYADYEKVKRHRDIHEDKYFLSYLPGYIFSIARTIMGMEQYFLEIANKTEKLIELHNKIEQQMYNMVINYAKAGADGIFLAEDWGTQERLLISPASWKEEFFPRFKRLSDLAKENGLNVFMHSCGKITSIIPLLIEAGIDVFQFDQPTLHGIDVLRKFQEQAKITYWSPVDIQTILQTKDEKLIRVQAREMLDKLWQGRGGFIAYRYAGDAAIGLEPKIQDWACDEFVKYGVSETYKK